MGDSFKKMKQLLAQAQEQTATVQADFVDAAEQLLESIEIFPQIEIDAGVQDVLERLNRALGHGVGSSSAVDGRSASVSKASKSRGRVSTDKKMAHFREFLASHDDDTFRHTDLVSHFTSLKGSKPQSSFYAGQMEELENEGVIKLEEKLSSDRRPVFRIVKRR